MRERVEAHPNLTVWAVLAIGMLVILAWSARDVSLSGSQWFWLGLATVALAGLCAWIISWEADEPEEPEDAIDQAAQGVDAAKVAEDETAAAEAGDPGGAA